MTTFFVSLSHFPITFTLNFTGIFIFILLLALSVWIFVRYRLLTAYSKLQAIATRSEAKFEDLKPLAPEIEDKNSKPYVGEFLTAFLSSIKIFGYLERPVFHELARHLQTRTLQAGEKIDDPRDLNCAFYIVVEGCVQVLSTRERPSALMGDAAAETEDTQLLNEFKDGSTLSSLFSILSLFAMEGEGEVKNSAEIMFPKMQQAESQIPSEGRKSSGPKLNRLGSRGAQQVYSDVIYRASRETVLAIIPAEAFRSVTEKFPTASAHMIQVILTRFQRVTFRTLHEYLGLKGELLLLERMVNQLSNCSDDVFKQCFPAELLDKVRQRFAYSNNSDLVSEADVWPQAESKKRRSIRNSAKLKDSTGSKRVRWSEDLENEVSLHEFLKNKASLVESDVGVTKISGLYEEALRNSAFVAFKNSINFISVNNTHTKPHEVKDDFSDASDASLNSPKVKFLDEFQKDIEIFFAKKGSILVKAKDKGVGMFLVIDGFLEICVESSNETSVLRGRNSDTKESFQEKCIAVIRPGDVAGYMTALTGASSYATIRAGYDTLVAHIPKATLDKMVERQPSVLSTLAKRVIMQLSPLILQIDYALEWIQVPAGQILYKQGDKSDSVYIVLNGRLRAIIENENDKNFEILGEYGQGESVGELEVLTEDPRPSTLHAIRDSEIAKMSKAFFNALSSHYPEITIQISRIVAARSKYYSNRARNGPISDLGQCSINLRTVAIMPIDKMDASISEFSEKLFEALQSVGDNTKLITHAKVTEALGRHVFTRIGMLKMSQWLAEQEEENRIVVYMVDANVHSPWTHRCIRQADCIFLVAHENAETKIGEFEKVMLQMKTTARKELILLHAERKIETGSTSAWLKDRPWIHTHYHVQLTSTIKHTHNRRFSLHQKSTIEALTDQLASIYRDYRNTMDVLRRVRKPNILNNNTNEVRTGVKSDFARLARRLCGKSVALVLGGGGARGMAQIGLIKAMEEYGIPVDIIGGTSIGSFVGGLYARDPYYVAIHPYAKSFSTRMSTKWRLLMDFTYPLTSWFTGHEFNRGLWKLFSNHRIEDFWLPYYCNTTNITWRRSDYHHTGYAWRFIRASMSLSGFLPPLCENGEMLLDGGYTDNLTVEYMKSLGAEYIIALDVAAVNDTSPFNFGDSVNGFWLLLESLNPFKTSPSVPSLAEIQSRLMYVSCYKQLELSLQIPGCLYIQPPVQPYKVMDFDKFEELFQLGYRHGIQTFKKWKKDGTIAKLIGEKATDESSLSEPKVRRRNSFCY